MEAALDLRSIRKEKGMKQEELAAMVGVSPQAVSKWEQGGMPDAALLPAIADALGVSIDRLFGRGQAAPDFYEQYLEHLSGTPWEKQMGELFHLGRLSGAGLCCWKYNASLFDNIEENVYTEHTREEGFFLGRLHEKKPFFILIPEPEGGYETAIPYDERFVTLFDTLAQPHVLRAMYYILSEPDAYFDADGLSSELSVSLEEAVQVIRRLQGIGFITAADYISGAVSKPIYRGRAYIEFISMLYFAQTLLNCPTAFAWQANSRETPWFREKTYKKNG